MPAAPPDPPLPLTDRAAPAEPDLPPALLAGLRRAQAALDEDANPEAALREFLAVLAERPNLVIANVGAGRCRLGLGQPRLAFRYFEQASRTVGLAWPLLECASQCRKAGETELAEAAYRRAAALAPDRPEPELGLALCARDRADWPEAAARQAAAAALAPDSASVQIDLARDLRRIGQIEAAQRVLERLPATEPVRKLSAILARDAASPRPRPASAQPKPAAPGPFGTLIRAAEAHRRNGDLAAARPLLEQARRLRPHDPALLLADARGAWADQRLEDAAGAFQAAARAGAATGPLLYFAASCRRSGQSDLALACFRTATSIAPDLSEAWTGLAACLRATNPVEAASAQERAVALAPDDPGLKLELARDWRAIGRTEDAAALAEALAADHPELKPAQRLAQAVARDHAQALRAARGRAHGRPEAAPSLPPLLDQAARAHRQGDLEQAAGFYDAALGLAPGHGGAMLGAARIAWQRDQIDRALQLFSAAAGQSANTAPLLAFANGCRRGGHLEEARQAYAQAASLTPDWAEPEFGLAECARRAGALAEACQHQERGLARAPDDQAARLLLASDHWRLGNRAAAQSCLDAVLEARPEDRAARALRAQIDALPDPGALPDPDALPHLAPPGAGTAHAGVGRTETGRVRALLRAADACRAASEPALAEPYYHEAAALDPGRPEPWAGLAACARARGHSALAAERARDAAERAPKGDTTLILLLAADLAAIGDPRACLAAIEEACAIAPRSAIVLRRAAALAETAGDPERAAALRDAAESAPPAKPGAMLGAAARALRFGQADEAAFLARALLETEPGHAGALRRLIAAERARGNLPAMLDAAERLHALAPTDPDHCARLLRALHETGNQPRLTAALDQARALHPDAPAILEFAIEHALGAGDPAQALDLALHWLAIAPTEPLACQLATVALSRLGRPSAAGALLDRAEAAGLARTAPLTLRRAQLHHQLGLPEPEPEPAPHADPCRLGEQAMDQADFDTACAHFQQAAAADPTDLVALHGLAQAELARLALTEAAEALRRIRILREDPARRWGRTTAGHGFLEAVRDEYRVDREALSALQALPAPPAARLEALRDLCRRAPDSTLLAASLLECVWHLPAPDRAGGQEPAIPRRVMQFWDQPPADLATLMHSVDEPGFVVMERFDDRSARHFLGDQVGQEALFAYHRGGTETVRADLFRLAWLHAQGGIAVDAFTRRRASLAALLPDGADLVLYRGELGLIGTGFIAARAGHPVLARAAEQAAHSINRGDRDLLWLALGPGLLTRCLGAHLAEAPDFEAARMRLCLHTRATIQRVLTLNCLGEWRATFQPRAAVTTSRQFTIRARGAGA